MKLQHLILRIGDHGAMPSLDLGEAIDPIQGLQVRRVVVDPTVDADWGIDDTIMPTRGGPVTTQRQRRWLRTLIDRIRIHPSGDDRGCFGLCARDRDGSEVMVLIKAAQLAQLVDEAIRALLSRGLHPIATCSMGGCATCDPE